MGHFHILLCEEMIFPLLKGKIIVRNEGISPCNFLINLFKNQRILKKIKMKNPCGNKCTRDDLNQTSGLSLKTYPDPRVYQNLEFICFMIIGRL